MKNDVPTPIGWLLLRKGHSVPITGLSPDDLKAARGSTIENDAEDLKYVTGLNAIVDSLGFPGDFGKYKNEHWDRIQRLLAERGLHTYQNLFDVPSNDLTFGLMRMRRRALADRIFVGPPPMPKRAFLGFGHDWERWDRLHAEVVPAGISGSETIEKVLKDLFAGVRPPLSAFKPRDPEEARRWIYANRHDLMGIHNFHGDQLLDLGKPGRFGVELYFPDTVTQSRREEELTRSRRVAEAFRWFIDQVVDGWIDIIPVTENLALLKGPSGTYDILWRDLRESRPQVKENARSPWGLHPLDVPSNLMAKQDFEAWNYFRRGGWDEKERHEAEDYHYAMGGRSGQDYPGSNVILERMLRMRGTYGEKPRLASGTTAPAGFQAVRIQPGKVLYVSGLVTVGDFRQFAEETDYFERRAGESWSAANDNNPTSAPVGATLLDALAYCGWTERRLGVAVRLFTVEEHRGLRPFASDHYKNLSEQDFPWENYPPRFGLEASVAWSEPRFLEPGPDLPEFPDENGVSSRSRKRWIASDNYPPHASWKDPLPRVEYQGISFIDAWDAYEWCGDGRVAGRFWEGGIGAESWGEYKNIKVSFRLVIDQERDVDEEGAGR